MRMVLFRRDGQKLNFFHGNYVVLVTGRDPGNRNGALPKSIQQIIVDKLVLSDLASSLSVALQELFRLDEFCTSPFKANLFRGLSDKMDVLRTWKNEPEKAWGMYQIYVGVIEALAQRTYTTMATGLDNEESEYDAGETALMLACSLYLPKTVAALIEAGAPVNAVTTSSEENALRWAIDGSADYNTEIINLLIAKGADIAHESRSVVSAYDRALIKKKPAIAQLLQDALTAQQAKAAQPLVTPQ